MDYNVWAANVAAQPNVFLTVTYKNMGAMQGSKEGYDALMKAMTERFNADQDEQEELAQGYEDYREIVDYVILNRVEYWNESEESNRAAQAALFFAATR